MNNQTGEIPIQSFKDWQQLLNSTPNKIAVLVGAFKTLHPDAPHDDDCPGGRLAGMVKQVSNDYGYVLLKIWMTSPASIAGSHLNYINAALKNGKPAPVVHQKYNPEKYVAGKYGSMVQR